MFLACRTQRARTCMIHLSCGVRVSEVVHTDHSGWFEHAERDCSLLGWVWHRLSRSRASLSSLLFDHVALFLCTVPRRCLFLLAAALCLRRGCMLRKHHGRFDFVGADMIVTFATDGCLILLVLTPMRLECAPVARTWVTCADLAPFTLLLSQVYRSLVDNSHRMLKGGCADDGTC